MRDVNLYLDPPPLHVFDMARRTLAAVGVGSLIDADRRHPARARHQLLVGAGHPVFHAITFRNADEFFSSLRLAHWRFLILDESAPIGVVDVPADDAHSRTGLGRISRNGYGTDFRTLLQALRTGPSEGRWTVRTIEINAAHARVLWLHSDASDRFAMYSDRPLQLVSATEVLARVRPRLARRTIKEWRSTADATDSR